MAAHRQSEHGERQRTAVRPRDSTCGRAHGSGWRRSPRGTTSDACMTKIGTPRQHSRIGEPGIGFRLPIRWCCRARNEANLASSLPVGLAIVLQSRERVKKCLQRPASRYRPSCRRGGPGISPLVEANFSRASSLPDSLHLQGLAADLVQHRQRRGCRFRPTKCCLQWRPLGMDDCMMHDGGLEVCPGGDAVEGAESAGCIDPASKNAGHSTTAGCIKT